MADRVSVDDIGPMQRPTGGLPHDAAESGEAIVRFDAVGARYGRAPEILKDITFSLRPGSFHFLTGASGAGKTSLLSLIYLANRPSRGFISLFGHDLATTPRALFPAMRRRIGVVFQDVRLLDHLNAFDNVALPLRLQGADPRTWRADVTELLAWVGLGERADAMPATLSGGERQCLAIARAVVARPDIILADEPTGNVDPAMAQRIMRLLTGLNRQGATVVVASHDRYLVANSRQPVLHLEDGRLTLIPEGVA